MEGYGEMKLYPIILSVGFLICSLSLFISIMLELYKGHINRALIEANILTTVTCVMMFTIFKDMEIK